VVENPETELVSLKEKYTDDPEWLARFERAGQRELERVNGFVLKRVRDFDRLSGIRIYEKRTELIAQMHMKTNMDINTAFEDFVAMYNQIKMEEASLHREVEINMTFDDGSIDELIKKAIETGQDVGQLAFQLAKKLEYGLKLVRDRSGVDHFTITREAVEDMEKYINDLVKKFYRKDYSYLSQKESE
jgi:KaiC/GvpD/RAD55 family RecA-like ATPase